MKIHHHKNYKESRGYAYVATEVAEYRADTLNDVMMMWFNAQANCEDMSKVQSVGTVG